MIPGHPSHSAMGAFHPTPIASSRTSDQPTTRRRRRRRAGTRRATSSPDDDEDIPRAQHAAIGTQGNYVNPHADSDEPHKRDTHAGACPTVAPPRPAPAPTTTGCAEKPDVLSAANGPSTVALQQRCHRASAPARSPSWPPMSRSPPQRPPPPGESRIRSPLRNRTFSCWVLAVGSFDDVF